jgi:adenosylhomocysteine nucleosidase
MSPGSTDEVHSAKRSARFRAAAPVPADIGVVAALPLEVGDLIDSLRHVRKYQSASLSVIEGEHQGKVVAVAVSGAGRSAARRAAELLIAGHRPSWIISAGFAGALSPRLARNDLVLPSEVIDPDGHRFVVRVPDSIASDIPHHRGRMLTVDRIILHAAEKQQLHQSFQADLVDMESAAVASVCDEKLIRFLAVRAISDDARSDLPREVATLLTRSGSYRIGAAIRAIWNRPSSLKDFWTLHEQALEAADRLAKFVSRCLDDIPN